MPAKDFPIVCAGTLLDKESRVAESCEVNGDLAKVLIERHARIGILSSSGPRWVYWFERRCVCDLCLPKKGS